MKCLPLQSYQIFDKEPLKDTELQIGSKMPLGWGKEGDEQNIGKAQSRCFVGNPALSQKQKR